MIFSQKQKLMTNQILKKIITQKRKTPVDKGTERTNTKEKTKISR